MVCEDLVPLSVDAPTALAGQETAILEADPFMLEYPVKVMIDGRSGKGVMLKRSAGFEQTE